MPKYKFLVSSGTVPEPADKSIRSHAIRTALRNKPKADAVDGDTSHLLGPASSQQDSRRIVEAKANLKGRFKVTIHPRKAAPKTRHVQQQPNTDGGNDDLNASEQHCFMLESFLRDQEPVQSIITAKLNPALHNSSWEAPSVVSLSIGGGLLDPFHTIPIDYTPRAERLLKYFLVSFNLNIATVDPQRTWSGLAMSDPLIMHTTLALSGSSWLSSKIAKGDDQWIRHEMLRQKGRGIQAINDRLAQSSITNIVFAAVACLANAACFEGAFHEADMHMRALRRLAGLRGGFSSFQDDFLTARAVTWSDTQTATALERLPFFPLNHAEVDDLFPEGLATNNGEWQDHLDNVRIIDGYDDQLVSAFSLLRRAIAAQEQILSPSHVRVVMIVAEHKLLDALFSRGDLPRQYTSARALLTAAHLFLYLVLRRSPEKGPVVRVLAKRLKDAIDGASREITSQIHTYAMVWILFVGVLLELQSEASLQHGLWFSPRLYKVCQILDLQNKQDVEGILRMFLFDENTCMDGLKQFWDTMESSGRLIEIVE